MTPSQIESSLRHQVSEQISLLPNGEDRYRVFTPFRFDDGDHIGIVLKKNADGWIMTDEGGTFMRLTYTIDEKDLGHGTRRKVINSALVGFGVEEEHGVLACKVEDESFGNALFNFAQAVLHVSDVAYLSRERAKSTFKEDLLRVVTAVVAKEKQIVDWHDESSDPNGTYPVDCRIQGNGKPLFLFGVQSDEKCHLATIVIQHYRQAMVQFNSLAVYQNQEGITRKPLARLTDVVDKQFSSLESNRQSIASFLSDWQKQHVNGSK